MLGLHLSAGPRAWWAFWDPSNPAGLVKKGYQATFHIQQFLPSHPRLASTAQCIIAPGTWWV